MPQRHVKHILERRLWMRAASRFCSAASPKSIHCSRTASKITLTVGRVILLKSVLSFLGFGVVPPTPSWGNMLNNAQELVTQVPALAIYPGLLALRRILNPCRNRVSASSPRMQAHRARPAHVFRLRPATTTATEGVVPAGAALKA